jgi:hypothetical protein
MIHVHSLEDVKDRQWNLATLVMVTAVTVAIGIFTAV